MTKDNWRVHVMLFRYLPNNLDMLTLKLLAHDQFVGYEHFFQEWKNLYLSNRELSSEFKYCFDRSHQNQYTGNMLDRPKLLLKRNLVQVTHSEAERLDSGTNYKERVEERYQRIPQQMIAPLKQQIQAPTQRMMTYSQPMAPPSCGFGAHNVYNRPCNIIAPGPKRIPQFYKEMIANQPDKNLIYIYQNFLSQEPMAYIIFQRVLMET